MVQPPPPTYWPLTSAEDKEVREQLGDLIIERSRANFDWYEKNTPGQPKLRPAERLQSYRLRPPEAWLELLIRFPALFKAQLLDWGKLLKEETG